MDRGLLPPLAAEEKLFALMPFDSGPVDQIPAQDFADQALSYQNRADVKVEAPQLRLPGR